MTLDVGRMADTEREEVAALVARTFAPDRPAEAVVAFLLAAWQSSPLLDPRLCWVARDGRGVVGVWQVAPLEVGVGGAPVRVAGALALCADARAREVRVLAAMTAAGRADFEREGFPVSIGFARRGGWFRRLGAVPIAAEYTWEVAARDLPSGDDGFAPTSDLGAMIHWHERFHRDRTGWLRRAPADWAWRWNGVPDLWLADRGYVGVREHDDAIELREAAGEGDFAVRALALLRRLARGRRVFGHLPADHPVVLASRALGARLVTEWPSPNFGMILEVRGFLDAIRPALVARAGGRSTALVVDCEGRHVLELEGHGPTEQVALACDRGELLQRAWGYPTAPGEPGIDRIFPEGHPYTWRTDQW